MHKSQEGAVAAAVIQEAGSPTLPSPSGGGGRGWGGAGKRFRQPAAGVKARAVAPGHDPVLAIKLFASVSAAGQKLMVSRYHFFISSRRSVIQAVTRRT